MKRTIPFFLAVGLLATNGCISTHVVQNHAKPHLEYDAGDQQARQVEGQPGFYALLPITIAGDVVTSPFQLLYWMLFKADGTASIDGFPIPLPRDFRDAK